MKSPFSEALEAARRIEEAEVRRENRRKIQGLHAALILFTLPIIFQTETILPELWHRAMYLLLLAALFAVPVLLLWNARRAADAARILSARGSHAAAVARLLPLLESEFLYTPTGAETGTILLAWIEDLNRVESWDDAGRLLEALRFLPPESVPMERVLLEEAFVQAGRGQTAAARSMALAAMGALPDWGAPHARAKALVEKIGVA